LCLITTAPKGTIKDKDKIVGFVTKGMKSNTDGSGYAIKQGGVLYLKKGFRSVEALIDDLWLRNPAIDDEIIIHHRIGTSGKRDNINMHPFIVSSDMEIVKTTEGTTKLPIMAHNGIFSEYSDYQSDFSDTFHFVKDFISTPEFLQVMKEDFTKFNKVFSPLIRGNKLAFLFEDSDMVLIGDFVKDDGFAHSNGGYKEYVFDRGGSSRHFNYGGKHDFTGGQNNRTTNGKVAPEVDFDTMSEAAWQDMYDQKLLEGNNSSSIITRTIDEIVSGRDLRNNSYSPTNSSIGKKTALKDAIKFTSKDITISEDNYGDFMFILDKPHLGMTMKCAYQIDGFTKDCEFNPVMSRANPNQIWHLNLNMFVDECTMYVKQEHKEKYEGYNLLIKNNGYSPSRSLVKKISAILKRKFSKDRFKFKGYGMISWYDLNNYYNHVKIEDKPITVVTKMITSGTEDNISTFHPRRFSLVD
jgi:hypothetical protein